MAPSPRPDCKLAPTNEEAYIQQRPLSGEEVVITGMSGKFPESPNIQTFMENLYNKEDMVTGDTRRWDLDHPEVPQRSGKIDCFNKFDAQFFGVHYKQAWTMEPMSRMLLENAYGAIFDAGINPRTLKNTKTGVFIGSSFSESEKTWFYEKVQVNGFGITGCSRSMYANRISYWLGTTGPSYCVDSACSSSLLALEHAYKAIKSGQCDAAIVGGVNLCLQPYVSLQFRRLGYISMDGKTKSFDKDGDGYARAESIGVLFLQRAKNAKRVYTELAHIKTNVDGPLCLGLRTAECMQRFLEEFYGEISVLPEQVEFIEAFGSGMAQSDAEELKAYDRVFCKNRRGPVLVGSVKSNMGHSEPASGVNAVTKVCLAYHKGEIAPNLHYNEPSDDMVGVREGRIRIVTEPTPFSGGYSAACSYSFSGVNVHALFKGYATKKQLGNMLTDDLPRLLVASGRSESAVKRIFNDVCSRSIDPEQIRLLHNIFESELPGHVFRGFNLIKLKDGETASVAQNVDYFPGLKRPVWFVYSGMGSQWSGMGAHLMRIPVFAAAIERCCRALAPKGLDLMHILTDPDPTIYDNILHSFVGIAAVQIGLTDVLTALGIKPDNIIGHSVGELGCAYADGCFTAEEMILSAYSRGLVSIQTPFIRGSMAAVGRGFQEMRTRCPKEIEVACHNGPDSCTISGPADIMKTFVGELTAEGIFAKEVPCSNIAYHSRYIAEAGPNLLKYLQEVIPEPKARSARWLSTSVPQSKWEDVSAQLSSAEYHTNNLLSPVLFEETSRQIPPNAITIEIAPHGLLQAILRRSLGDDCTNIPLTRRGHTDNVEYLLSAIGKLYQVGLNPQVANIYPEVQFPVSVDTPMLSHLVEWEHSEDWYAPKFNFPDVNCSGERDFAISICDQEYKFLSGHVINGTNVIPAAQYLVLAWETLGMILGRHYSTLSVVFENIHFCGDWPLHRNKTVPFNIMVHKGNGYFEVAVEGNKLATGTIKAYKSSLLLQKELQQPEDSSEDDMILSEEDVYRVLAVKGHLYSGLLRGIEQTDLSTTRSELKWRENWTSFLDSMMQLEALRSDWGGVTKPKRIIRLTINTRKHRRALAELPEDKKCLPCTTYSDSDTKRCGGVELFGLKTVNCQKLLMHSTLVHKYEFVSNTNSTLVEIKEAVRTQVQLALLNSNEDSFNVIEIVDVDNVDNSLESVISEVLKDTPHVTNGHHVKILKVKSGAANVPAQHIDELKNADLVITSNISHNKIMNEQLFSYLGENKFVLSRENRNFDEKRLGNNIVSVSVKDSSESSLVLLKKQSAMNCSRGTKYITVKSSSKWAWLQLLQAEWRNCDRLVLISECDPSAGLLGIFNCLRREPGGHMLTMLLIDDYSAPAFRPDLPFYQEQLSKNLAINVYRNGAWGSYQYVPLQPVSVHREHVYLAIQRPEDISSLAWVEGPLTLDSAPSHPTKKLVKVYYSAISQQDIHKVMGINNPSSNVLSKTNVYGKDLCGRTSSGERVMGLVQSGALSSLVEADVDMLWPVPPHWSMEDAATVPLAYANIFYCLDRASLSLNSSDSVLIHNGTDPLSQAAINVCLGMGATVYTTVDTIHKKQLLLKAFPTLTERNIGNSKDESFEDMVMKGTKGKGCKVVMSTQSEHLHDVSLRCTRNFGLFLNLNFEEITENKPFGMYHLIRSGMYAAPNITNIFKKENIEIKKNVQRLVAEGIASGYVQPLSRVVLGASEAPRAFRFTSTERHTGKMLLKLRDEELRPLVTPSHELLAAQPNFLCSEDGNYLIISGPEYSGLELADWLIQRGAKSLVLHSSKHASGSGYHTFKVRCWRRQGIKIHLSAENLQTEMGCLQLLTDAAKQAPVLGLFVSPRSSYRELFEQSPPKRFAEDFAEKALVVMNLDSATRKFCPHLKQFVVWSSAAAGRGAAGCSSGSLADSVLERVCEERGKLGLPALAMQLDENDVLEDNTAGAAYSSLDALLRTTTRVAFAARVPIPPRYRGVFETVQDVIGVDLNSVPSKYTLQDISITKLSAEQISQALRVHFQIFMTQEKILKTTLNEFKMIDEQANNKDTLNGLGVFFSYIDPEEFNAAEELVGMATVVSSGTETECEFNKKDKYVILVPSMEGHRHIFPVVARRLKVNSYSCQLGDDVTETIPDIAARLGKVILRKMEPEATFSLVGYGFGVAVALEMASILEKHGHVGQVFCLDGSPRWFPVLLDTQLGHLTEQQLQNAVIEHMFCIMLASEGGSQGVEDEALQRLQRSLEAESDWERKLDICMRHLRGRVKFSFQYQRSLVAMAYARIQQARAYSDAALLSRPLLSELVLLKAMRRPRSLSAAAEALGRDLGLGAYSQKPVTIHELDCDHAAAPFDLSVSDIINARVADLQHFKKLNLCIQYIPETVARIF